MSRPSASAPATSSTSPTCWARRSTRRRGRPRSRARCSICSPMRKRRRRSRRRDRYPSTSRILPPTMKLPRKARAVVFDMDGLLFNTEALYRDAIMAAAAEGDHDIPLAFYLSTIGMSGEATRTAFNERCGTAFDFDLFWTTASTQFRDLSKLQLCLKAGVVELLDFLDEAGRPRATATSSRHEDVQFNLGAQGLLHRFETIIARGDYSRGKP